VVAKKEGTVKVQEKEKELQQQQGEIAPEVENKVKAEPEMEELFDPESADREELLAKFKELEEQLGKAEERVLRTAAEAENFKKRLQREKEEQIRYANETFMRELLPVIDNLERAIQHAAAVPNQQGLLEGLDMTLKGFLDTLAKFNCLAIEAVGKPFDPNFHEAVSQEENAEVEPNTVLKELQKGYLLRERLLRPAMVIVSKPATEVERDTRDQEPTETKRAKNGEVKIPIRKI
jgi:molecular chaperone GrpE